MYSAQSAVSKDYDQFLSISMSRLKSPDDTTIDYSTYIKAYQETPHQ